MPYNLHLRYDPARQCVTPIENGDPLTFGILLQMLEAARLEILNVQHILKNGEKQNGNDTASETEA